MHGSSSPSADFPFGLRSWEVRVSIVAWGLYIACQAAYCTIYERLVLASADFEGMLLWAVSSWGIWALVTPLTFKGLRRRQAAPDEGLWPYVKFLAGMLLLALILRAGIDYATAAHGVVESSLIFLPRYLVALAAIVLVWHFFLREKPPVKPPTVGGETTPAENQTPTGNYPDTLLVDKGNDECLIRVDRIQHISAARNYVEIYCDHQHYLMRATMKQVEEQLPPSMFLRTHRSHIVNVNQIERIRTLPSGNGTVQLRCGKTLSLSRKYRDQLQNYRLTAA